MSMISEDGRRGSSEDGYIVNLHNPENAVNIRLNKANFMQENENNFPDFLARFRLF